MKKTIFTVLLFLAAPTLAAETVLIFENGLGMREIVRRDSVRDLTQLTSEETPSQVCYQGDLQEAKEILFRLISSIDSTSASDLDSGSVWIEESKLKAIYSIYSEDDKVAHSFTISPCR